MSHESDPVRLLLVEDDASIRETTSLLLEQLGFEVSVAEDGSSGLAAYVADPPDIALLDIMLPGIDGITLTRAIRERAQTPIVLLSALDAAHDIVAGLEAGADDYVTKPFEGAVLAARLRAVLRRAQPEDEGARDIVQYGDLAIDEQGASVTRAGEELHLTATELRLLLELSHNAGVVLSRDTLLERVWGYAWGGDTRLVDVHIQRLRAKIGAERVLTVRGTGYKWAR